MNASDFDLREALFSVISRILETVDSPKTFSTFAVSVPLMLTQPLESGSPTPTARGTDSPVSEEVSISLVPERIVQSSGIFSPLLMRIVSPILTDSGATCL